MTYEIVRIQNEDNTLIEKAVQAVLDVLEDDGSVILKDTVGRDTTSRILLLENISPMGVVNLMKIPNVELL